jgi:hypothetical protein
MGDGVLVYFGYPQAHEDDSERAVRAGLAVIEAVSQLPARQRLSVRLGIATGLAVVGDLLGEGSAQERGVVGETPNLAARLQALAAPNTLVIGEATRRQVGGLFDLEDLGRQELAGFAERQTAWRVLAESGMLSRFEALRSGDTPLVGREEDVELLVRCWQQVKGGEGRVVLISGEPGIGKSRLTVALSEHIGTEPHTRLRYFCSPHHQDSALYPFVTHLERAARFTSDDTIEEKLGKLRALLAPGMPDDDDITLLSELLSLPNSAAELNLIPQRKREKLFEALLSQLAAEARQQPVLMVFEDAHWIDPSSRELLDLTVDRVRRLPVMLAVTFRSEFQPPWSGRAHVTSLALNRLGEHDSKALVQTLAGNAGLAADIVTEIVERTDGVPLFVEEMTKAVLEAGAERGREVAASVPGAGLGVPATLQASLMARLDRLGPAAKGVAQIGAAIGREFSYELLAAVARRDDADLVDTLDQLAVAGLVFRHGTPPRASFVFKHALVQDAAYSTLLRGQRQNLHGRIGHALQISNIAETQPEIVAHHLTEARIIDSAIDYWRKAAERSLRRSAGIEAVRHLLRGIELTQSQPSSPEQKRRTLEQYLALGRMTRIVKGMAASDTLKVFSEARDLLDKDATVEQQMVVLYGLWGVHEARAEHDAARAVALECLRLSEPHAQREAAVLANYLMGDTLWATGEFVEARHHLERSIALCAPTRAGAKAEHARHNHDITALSYLAVTLWPLGYPNRAAATAQQAAHRARESGHVPLIAFVSFIEVFLATALAATDAPNAASADQAIAYSVEHGLAAYELWTRFCLGITVARRGEPRRGIEIMRAAMDALAQIDAKILRPLHLGHLAAAHASLGQIDIGLGLIDEALHVAGSTGERAFEAELHRLHGELLIDHGKKEAAETALQAAMGAARGQQARLWELRAATRLARLQRDLGREGEAKQTLAPVYGWFTEGFDTVDLKAAKALLHDLD